MTDTSLTLDQINVAGDRTLGVSKWIRVTQADINAFADVTHDWQFIHVDQIAASEGPFETTIAHGFLTLALLSEMSFDTMPRIDGVQSSLNYGFNKVRFLSPVRSGERVRGHFVLKHAEQRRPDSVLLAVDVSVEIEDRQTPALVAEWLIQANIEK